MFPATRRRGLSADSSLISLAYGYEHPVISYEFGGTRRVWAVTTRIGTDLLAGEAAAIGAALREALGAAQDITVGRTVFVRIRGGGSGRPRAGMDGHSGDVVRSGGSVGGCVGQDSSSTAPAAAMAAAVLPWKP